VTGVARSGYYAWRRCHESARAVENKLLATMIRQLFEESRETYGSPRIFHMLRRRGYKYGRNRIARLMRAEKIRAVQRRAFRVTTVASSQKPAPNRLQQNFRISIPNRIWTSDITYIATQEGWLYLAVILDLYSRRVVGWSMQERMADELVITAFDAAWQQRRPNAGLILHSDRGFQYTGQRFREALSRRECIQSMSATGNCYDNAVTETFFHTLKIELVNRTRYLSRNNARKSIFEYIESFYNRKRLHSTLGYKCPVEFEEELVSTISG
jgi:putative transposase